MMPLHNGVILFMSTEQPCHPGPGRKGHCSLELLAGSRQFVGTPGQSGCFGALLTLVP